MSKRVSHYMLSIRHGLNRMNGDTHIFEKGEVAGLQGLVCG